MIKKFINKLSTCSPLLINKNNKFIDKVINKLSTCSPILLVILSTVLVSFLSAAVVFVFTSLFSVAHTTQLFGFSIIMPLLTTPIIVSLLLVLTKHLKHFKDMLEVEIDKNKKKDIMLFEQARFVLMGEMMANISHQWKQPLNTIGLSVVSARMANINGQPHDRYFDIIESNVNYLASTINDFMSFFDKKTYLEIKDLSNIVKEIKSIIEVQMQNRGIKLNIEIDSNHGDIGMASSISQVILNLLSNSKDAFNASKVNKGVTLKFESLDKGIKISCCDNGKGIDADIRDKIFDPYFTTKDKTQGIGIGLYMSKQIVQKVFGGEIDVISTNDLTSKVHSNKTCFHVTIPYSDKCVLKENQQ